MYVTEVVIAKLAEMRMNKRGVAELVDAPKPGDQVHRPQGTRSIAGSSPAPATTPEKGPGSGAD